MTATVPSSYFHSNLYAVALVRVPIADQPGVTARYDAGYGRNGVAHLMAFYAPSGNWHRVGGVVDNPAAKQWAEGVRRLVQEGYPGVRKIALVMGSLNTHTSVPLYKAFAPELARALLDKLEFVYTPKHGSWLNRAECGFSVLSG